MIDDWLDGHETLEWVAPRGRRRRLPADPPVGRGGSDAAFYRVLLEDHGTYVGPGHWFEVSDRHFRLGYGWPTLAELRDGLDALLLAAGDAARESLGGSPGANRSRSAGGSTHDDHHPLPDRPPPPRAEPSWRSSPQPPRFTLSACRASGGSDSSARSEPKDPTTTTTEATETTTTAAAEPAERTVEEPAPAGTVFTIGDPLYETDLTSNMPGGWPAANQNHAYGSDGLTITVGDGKTVYSTPVDEKFPGNVMVEARWALDSAPPLVGLGVACRSSKAGAYIGAVTESPITAGAWTWGIYKKVGDESFEQLLGSGIDGEGPIPLTRTLRPSASASVAAGPCRASS